MGFVKIVKKEDEYKLGCPQHCPKPDPNDYGLGTIWDCDECKARWVLGKRFSGGWDIYGNAHPHFYRVWFQPKNSEDYLLHGLDEPSVKGG